MLAWLKENVRFMLLHTTLNVHQGHSPAFPTTGARWAVGTRI